MKKLKMEVIIRDLSNDEFEKTKRMHNPWDYNYMSVSNLKDKRNKLQDNLTMLQKMIDKSSKEENWACGRYSDQTRLLAKIELIDEMIKELWIYD